MEIGDKLGGVCSPWSSMNHHVSFWKVAHLMVWPSGKLKTPLLRFGNLVRSDVRWHNNSVHQSITMKNVWKAKKMKKNLHFRAMSHESWCKNKTLYKPHNRNSLRLRFSTVRVLHLQFSHGRSIDVTLFRGIDADTWDLSITNRGRFEADRGKILESSFWHL